MRKEYDFTKGKRGPVITPLSGKTRITIRLDNDVVEWFKAQVTQAGGGNYQTPINRRYESSSHPATDPSRRLSVVSSARSSTEPANGQVQRRNAGRRR